MKFLNTKSLATATLFAVVFAAAPVLAATNSKNTSLEDTWVTAKTKIALAADSRVKGSQVSVETNDGVVMLRGKVDTREARDASTIIANSIDGAKSIKNDLQVVAPSRRDSVTETDEAITARVKEQIKSDAYVLKNNNLKNAQIKVVTNAGVVSLSGDVSTLLVSAQASWTAWQIAGVKSVKNDLIVVNN
jgi:hyperosmotically inducible periplasmic protein